MKVRAARLKEILAEFQRNGRAALSFAVEPSAPADLSERRLVGLGASPGHRRRRVRGHSPMRQQFGGTPPFFLTCCIASISAAGHT